MPKNSLGRRSPAAIAAISMVAASAAALLVSSATAPPAGAEVAPGSTQRVSVHDDEGQSEDGGRTSVISEDGASVAFVSPSNLDPTLPTAFEGSNDAVFVRDLRRGRTVMISRGYFSPPVIGLTGSRPLSLNGARAQPTGEREEPPSGSSSQPTISATGQYVAFRTFADNVAPFGTSASAIVLCDRDPDGDGEFDEFRTTSEDLRIMTNQCVRLTSAASASPSVSEPKLSADANRIVWRSFANESRLQTRALGRNPNGSVNPGPVEPVPSVLDDMIVRGQDDPAISGDGNHIAMRVNFLSCSECSAPVEFNAIMSTDVETKVSTRVDFENNEPISTRDDIVVMHPAMSFDGTVIAFTAEDFDVDHQPYVYAVTVDYRANRVTRSVIVSRDNQGGLATGQEAALSTDGRYVAFVTDAVNMHDGVDRPELTDGQSSCINQGEDFAGPRLLNLAGTLPPPRDNVRRTLCQVVVRDLILDQNSNAANRVPGTLAAPGTSRNCVNALPAGASCVGNDEAVNPSLSGDGGRIGFDSFASDLVPGDGNQRRDAFVRTLTPGLRGVAVEFGPVERPGSLVRTAQIEQVGSGPLLVESVTLSGTNAADFTITGQTCVEQTLHQAGTCGVTVRFTPSALGNRTAQLVVRARGLQAPVTVILTGSGTDKPVPRAAEFSATPIPLDFGQRPLLSSGPEATVTVTNGGETPLTISAVAVVGPGAPGDYTIGSNTCAGVSVQPDGQCTVSVKFSPTLPGDRLANLQFTDNAVGGPHLVGLRGSAGGLTLEASPGVTPPGRAVTVTGKGYPPGKTVTVTFTNGAIGKATATVGADGVFRAALIVFQKAKPENRTLVATVDGSPALFANAQLLIVFPTVSPADFVVRG